MTLPTYDDVVGKQPRSEPSNPRTEESLRWFGEFITNLRATADEVNRLDSLCVKRSDRIKQLEKELEEARVDQRRWQSLTKFVTRNIYYLDGCRSASREQKAACVVTNFVLPPEFKSQTAFDDGDKAKAVFLRLEIGDVRHQDDDWPNDDYHQPEEYKEAEDYDPVFVLCPVPREPKP